MSQLGKSRRGLISGLLLLFLVLAAFSPTPAVHAQAGIAMAGTFSQQIFELPQGTEVSSPSIYVVVFNHTAEELNVHMLVTAPFGVEVLFDQTSFLLPPGGEQKVYVTVKVTDDAIPGEYEVVIAAEAVPKEGEGAVIATASAQKASLTVTGEAAWVSVRVISPDGDPIKAQVRLFKVIQDRLNELALSETGTLEAKISPGHYKVSAYIAGRTLAEETVEVGAGERKEIILTVRTVYFEQFGIEPNYAPDTGLLAFVRTVYTLNNLYQLVNNAEVVLVVSRDDKPLEQVSLISFGRLDLGRTGGSYSYMPAEGWKAGNYGLKLELYIEGEFYTDSSEEKLSFALPAPSLIPLIPPALLELGIMWWWIVAGTAATATVAVVILMARRRRYPLTVNVTPIEGGSVVVSPELGAGSKYRRGQKVTLTAIANDGYIFAGWSGDVSDMTNPVTIVMNSDKSVTATFEALRYTLMVEVTPMEGGTVAVSPEPGADSKYGYGQEVTLTAIANDGYIFAGWSGDLSDMTNPVTIIMDSDKSVTATFNTLGYTLTVNVTPAEGGTVMVSPEPGADSKYGRGQEVTLTAIANDGYTFAGWSGDVSDMTNPVTITMDSDKSVTATFDALYYA